MTFAWRSGTGWLCPFERQTVSKSSRSQANLWQTKDQSCQTSSLVVNEASLFLWVLSPIYICRQPLIKGFHFSDAKSSTMSVFHSACYGANPCSPAVQYRPRCLCVGLFDLIQASLTAEKSALHLPPRVGAAVLCVPMIVPGQVLAQPSLAMACYRSNIG